MHLCLFQGFFKKKQLLTVGIFLSLLKVILIENKEESLVRAQSRSAELGLKNIGFIQANLDYFTGPFHIGVSIASYKNRFCTICFIYLHDDLKSTVL